MKTRKILSLLMAVAMVLSLSVTALASELDAAPEAAAATATTHNAQYTGNTSVPTINLAIAGTNSALAFNPYKLAVKVDANGAPNSDGPNTMDDQLIAKEIVITNLTNVPLKMEGSFKVTPYHDSSATVPEGDAVATLSNKALAATETSKKIYAYADFYTYDDSSLANVPDTAKAAASAQRLVAATAGTAVKHTAANRVLLNATDGTNPNYCFVKVSGEATAVPTMPWQAYDKVQIDLVFSFQSQGNYPKYVVTDKGDYDPTSSPAYTVLPVYSKNNVAVAKGSDLTDLTKGVAANALAGYVMYITPATNNKVTAVKFYDKTGTTAITSVKAASTNTKDPLAPWSFTMPADGVVMEVTTAQVSS